MAIDLLLPGTQTMKLLYGNLGRHLLEAGRPDEAVELLQSALKLDPAKFANTSQSGWPLPRGDLGQCRCLLPAVPAT